LKEKNPLPNANIRHTLANLRNTFETCSGELRLAGKPDYTLAEEHRHHKTL